MRSEYPTWPAVALMLVLAAFVGGCQSNTPGVALPASLGGNDPQMQMDFWHVLPERKVVSNDEAFHALLLFVDGNVSTSDYAGRVKLLTARQMLPSGFSEDSAAAIRRGTVAVAMVRALRLEGGLTIRVFGVHPRYAVREMEYVGLFPPSSPQQTFSGAEFLGIIGRAEDYQRARPPDEGISVIGESAAPAVNTPVANTLPTTRPVQTP
jgi:hypothetical protein